MCEGRDLDDMSVNTVSDSSSLQHAVCSVTYITLQWAKIIHLALVSLVIICLCIYIYILEAEGQCFNIATVFSLNRSYSWCLSYFPQYPLNLLSILYYSLRWIQPK